MQDVKIKNKKIKKNPDKFNPNSSPCKKAYMFQNENKMTRDWGLNRISLCRSAKLQSKIPRSQILNRLMGEEVATYGKRHKNHSKREEND